MVSHIRPGQIPAQEPRDSERVAHITLCSYEQARFSGSTRVDLSEGHAITLNRSSKGLLLLLPQAVAERHLFEITTERVAKEKPTTKLVEVRWTRPLSVIGHTMHLAGVRVLFEPPVSAT